MCGGTHVVHGDHRPHQITAMGRSAPTSGLIFAHKGNGTVGARARERGPPSAAGSLLNVPRTRSSTHREHAATRLKSCREPERVVPEGGRGRAAGEAGRTPPWEGFFVFFLFARSDGTKRGELATSNRSSATTQTPGSVREGRPDGGGVALVRAVTRTAASRRRADRRGGQSGRRWAAASSPTWHAVETFRSTRRGAGDG